MVIPPDSRGARQDSCRNGVGGDAGQVHRTSTSSRSGLRIRGRHSAGRGAGGGQDAGHGWLGAGLELVQHDRGRGPLGGLDQFVVLDRGQVHPAGLQRRQQPGPCPGGHGQLNHQLYDLDDAVGGRWLGEAGAATPQIAALSGHPIDYYQSIIDAYLPRQTEVALGGIVAWERADTPDDNVVDMQVPG